MLKNNELEVRKQRMEWRCGGERDVEGEWTVRLRSSPFQDSAAAVRLLLFKRPMRLGVDERKVGGHICIASIVWDRNYYRPGL
jgi:hypothetical protein